jgi:hypothetical protein
MGRCALIFALMTKLVVALTKQVVRSNFSETGTTVLTCLIDFVSAQESATQKMLARMERKIDDLHQNPFRLGSRMLLEAQRVADSQLRMDRIKKALDSFTQAAEYTQISDPLLPLKARLSAGACYDLLQEGMAAIANYEEVFQNARELQKIVQDRPMAKNGSEAFRDAMSDPLDAFLDWLETREPGNKEREQFRSTLVEIKPELDDFVEKLLLLILERKGLTREQYLGVPVKPKTKTTRQTNTFSQTGRLTTLPFGTSPISSMLHSNPHPLICPTCRTFYTFIPCSMCHGTKMQGFQPCVACGGTGSVRTCKCTMQLSTGILNKNVNRFGRSCALCKGTGRIKF